MDAAADPAAGIGVLTALAAGLVSFLSPCVLPLVPGYLSAVTGVAPSELENADRRAILFPSLLFVGSFTVIFMLLGVGATAIGDTLIDNRDVLEKVAGGVILAMGILFVASVFVARLNRGFRIDALMARAGTGGPIVAGAAFAIAWTPCVGPTLGAILTAASLSDSASHGAYLLGWYSAGLAIPFLATGLAFSRATSAFSWVKRHYVVIIGIGGAILVAMGILMLTGDFFRLNIEAQRLTNELGLAL